MITRGLSKDAAEAGREDVIGQNPVVCYGGTIDRRDHLGNGHSFCMPLDDLDRASAHDSSDRISRLDVGLLESRFYRMRGYCGQQSARAGWRRVRIWGPAVGFSESPIFAAYLVVVALLLTIMLLAVGLMWLLNWRHMTDRAPQRSSNASLSHGLFGSMVTLSTTESLEG